MLCETLDEAQAAFQYVQERGNIKRVTALGSKTRPILDPVPPLDAVGPYRSDLRNWFLHSGHRPSMGWTCVFRGLETGVFSTW